MGNAGGFTLAELLVAIAVAAIVAGTAYVLLDSGLSMHDRSSDLGVSTVGMARAMTILRADVSSAATITYSGTDSLVLARPDGDAVEWAARGRADGLEIFRSVDTGSGFSERPKQAIATLLHADAAPAALDFTELASGVVRARLTGDGHSFTIDAAPWESP